MARRSKFKPIKALLFLLLLGGAAYGAWYWFNQDENQIKPTYTAVKIERGDLIQMVTASGALNPVINVQVGSQISGQIKKIYVDFNSKVKAGELVAEIDPATYQTRLLQNEADLASAMASLQLAEVNASRAKELHKNKLIPQAEYDTTMANLAQAKAQVQTREAQVNSTKVDLSRCSIFAPIDGIVIDRKVDVGQTVAASMNAPVLFIIANDLSKMQINASVAEADIGSVTTGQEVKFTVDAFPNREFVGKVVQVRNAPQTVQNVVSYDTIIEVDNADGKLKPGMTANVQIITAKKEGVVRIPNSALRFRPPTVPGQPVAVPAESKGASNAVASATGAAPQTPEALILEVKKLRERGEQLPEDLRARFSEMIRSGKIQPQQLAAAGLGGGSGSGGGSGFGGPRGEGPGGPGGSGGRSRSGGARKGGSGGDRQSVRTVYLVPDEMVAEQVDVSDMKATVIKTGITDGIYTEVVEGLKEGDQVVTGQVIATTGTAQRPTNPFGGGSRRGP